METLLRGRPANIVQAYIPRQQQKVALFTRGRKILGTYSGTITATTTATIRNGGKGQQTEIHATDRTICERLALWLKNGIFAGIDIISDS
ncbi:MAG: hypothetical protein U1F27_17025 [Turneriella sp.]